MAAPGENWSAINAALEVGTRGLPGDSSIAQLLAAKRGVRNHMALPPLTIQQILKWADEYHKRTGDWPHKDTGPITRKPAETWLAVETALSKGKRGLPGGSSLAQLLKSERGVRNIADLPCLQHWEILLWADAYHERTGRWPTPKSGPIPEAKGETWSRVNTALVDGLRGLPGGDSLARFLQRRRGVPNKHSRPRLSKKQILRWVDEHRRRTGEWPTKASGAICGADGQTWGAVNHVLDRGSRGLSGKSSLAQLLAEARGVPNKSALPSLTHEKILEWADAHHTRTGRWPTIRSGSVVGAPNETWLAINAALRTGNRGLPGGDSLARLLTKHRGKRNHLALSPLTIRKILAWADAHHARFGSWPSSKSDLVTGVPGQTWAAVDMALQVGVRGLPGDDSLARLLSRCRGVRNRNAPPALTITQIKRWVRAHYGRTGYWPKRGGGVIPNTQGETWSAVSTALSDGLRGLPGGSSLAQVVAALRAKSPAN